MRGKALFLACLMFPHGLSQAVPAKPLEVHSKLATTDIRNQLRQLQEALFFHNYTKAKGLIAQLKSTELNRDAKIELLLAEDALNAWHCDFGDQHINQAASLAGQDRLCQFRVALQRQKSSGLRKSLGPDPWSKVEALFDPHFPAAERAEFYLARADICAFDNDQDGREKNLAQAAQESVTGVEAVRVKQALFYLALSQEKWEAAEQLIGELVKQAGPDGVYCSLEWQALLAKVRGQISQSALLWTALADLEKLRGESLNEVSALIQLANTEKEGGIDFSQLPRSQRCIQKLPTISLRYRSTQQLAYWLKAYFSESTPYSRANEELFQKLPSTSQAAFLFNHLSQITITNQTSPAQQLELVERFLGEFPQHRLRLLAAKTVLLEKLDRLNQSETCAQAAFELALSSGSDQDRFQCASNLLSIVKRSRGSQVYFETTKMVLGCVKTASSRGYLLRSTLGGSEANKDLLIEQQRLKWSWRQLNDLLPELNCEQQLQNYPLLIQSIPKDVALSTLLEPALQLADTRLESSLREQNWSSYSSTCNSKAEILKAANRKQDALETLLLADQVLGKAAAIGPQTKILELLARVQKDLARIDEFRATTIRTLNLTPDPNRRSNLHIGLALSFEQAEPEKALAIYDEALSERCSTIERRRLLTFKISLLVRLKRYQAAIAILEDPILENAESWMRHTNLGRLAACHECLGQFDKAEQIHLQCLKENPTFGTAHQIQNYLAYSFFLSRQKRSQDSLKISQQAYEKYVETVTGQDLNKLVIEYCRQLFLSSKPQEAIAVLSRHKIQKSDLKSLERFPELQQWIAQTYPAEPARSKALDSSQRAQFLATLAKLRGLRPDLDSHALLQSSQVERIQAKLASDQVLVAAISERSDLYLLFVSATEVWSQQIQLDGRWLEQNCSEFRTSLASGKEPGALASLLGARLIEPLNSRLSGKRILFAPMQEQWYSPWEAVAGPNGKAIGLTNSVTRVSSVDLQRLASGEWTPWHLSGALLLGAPPEADLPGATLELENLSKKLPNATKAVGPLATAEALKTSANLVHIATHSYVLPNDPSHSYIQLHQNKLTLNEIYGLHLPAHSLVVLSSCSSGQGQPRPGGEPISLANAFAATGSSTQVSALWPVGDDASAAFFEQFYASLLEGKSPGEAMLLARNQLARKGFSVGDWSAFTLKGCPD